MVRHGIFIIASFPGFQRSRQFKSYLVPFLNSPPHALREKTFGRWWNEPPAACSASVRLIRYAIASWAFFLLTLVTYRALFECVRFQISYFLLKLEERRIFFLKKLELNPCPLDAWLTTLTTRLGSLDSKPLVGTVQKNIWQKMTWSLRKTKMNSPQFLSIALRTK